MSASLMLLDADRQPVKQVLILADSAYSFERIDGVLIGTHAEQLTDRQIAAAMRQLDGLADEWSRVPRSHVERRSTAT